MSHHFLAMMHRMRYINRWSLMRNTQSENIQEHSLQVAMIAHALTEIRLSCFAAGRPAVDRAQVILLALYHDAGEILTGDMPTPVKYANPAIRDAYKAVETVAAEKLLSMLPDELEPAYRSLFLPDLTDLPTAEAMKLVKAADRISAFIKCLDEEKAGNSEFRQARQAVQATLEPVAA
ncbi:MAG: 5'-deoxynucleotidase, partial [Bacillota bacterium]|nr:5'-deoxynucleotidase [Bacillota bacterium]